MGIKDLLNKFINFAKEESVYNEHEDIPTVSFSDDLLQISIGQWLDVLCSAKKTSYGSIETYMHLSARELSKCSIITKKELNEISRKFGMLLKQAGVSSDEVCKLSDFDESKLSFKCSFNHSGESANITLVYGCFMDSGPELIIEHNNSIKHFDYFHAYNDKEERVELSHYTLKNPENGNTLWRYLSPFSGNIYVSSGDYNLSIDVKAPESDDAFPSKNFEYANAEQLEQYLLGLTFPIAIDEVFAKVCELSLGSTKDYPQIVFKVTKKDEKKEITTDYVSLKSGELTNFIITKDNKTYELDENNNWSYKTPVLSVSKNTEGEINYSLNSLSETEIASLNSPLDYINQANAEIQSIGESILTLVKKTN